MGRRKMVITTTKYEIIQVASELFLTRGYSATSPKMIAAELGLSPGNVTYYFPTKEDLLAVIVEMLCDFQWKMLTARDTETAGGIGSICLEMLTVAAGCQESAVMRDFFLSAFHSDLSRSYLRRSHIERAKVIFAKECADWSEERFVEAEVMIMGLQEAAISATDDVLPLERRVRVALELILGLYGVDSETREREIGKVLQMDSRGVGRRVLEEFRDYVQRTNEHLLSEIIQESRALRKQRLGQT